MISSEGCVTPALSLLDRRHAVFTHVSRMSRSPGLSPSPTWRDISHMTIRCTVRENEGRHHKARLTCLASTSSLLKLQFSPIWTIVRCLNDLMSAHSSVQCLHHLWDGCLLPVRPGLAFWLILFWCSCHNQIIEDDMILEGGWQHGDCCKLSIGYLCTPPQPKIFHLFGRKVAAFNSFPFRGDESFRTLGVDNIIKVNIRDRWREGTIYWI